jgi:hypothetical protein
METPKDPLPKKTVPKEPQPQVLVTEPLLKKSVRKGRRFQVLNLIFLTVKKQAPILAGKLNPSIPVGQEYQLERFIWPSEAILVLLSLVLAGYSSVIVGVSFEWLVSIGVYVGISTFLYLYILRRLRRSGKLESMWHAQVIMKEKQRVSAGAMIMLLRTFHILIFLVSLLIISTNFLYVFEGTHALRWTQALCLTIKSTGIGVSCSAELPTDLISRLLSVGDILIGLILLSFWVTIFMKTFDAVFLFFKNP